LQSRRGTILNEIELFGKFKDKFKGQYQDTITLLTKEIKALEEEVAKNLKLKDLVLIEIKAILAKTLAEIEHSPEVAQVKPQKQQLPIV